MDGVYIFTHLINITFAFRIHLTLETTICTGQIVERNWLKAMSSTHKWNSANACVTSSFFLFLLHINYIKPVQYQSCSLMKATCQIQTERLHLILF